jgi:hypothetical protein
MIVQSAKSTFQGRGDAEIIYRIVRRGKHYAKCLTATMISLTRAGTLCLDLYKLKRMHLRSVLQEPLLLKRDLK